MSSFAFGSTTRLRFGRKNDAHRDKNHFENSLLYVIGKWSRNDHS